MIARVVVATCEIQMEANLEVLGCCITEIDAIASVIQAGVPAPWDAIARFIQIT